MEDHMVSEEKMEQFRSYLTEFEKAKSTVKKYVREVKELQKHLAGEKLTKKKMIAYREELQKKHQARTVNGKLSAINSYLKYFGIRDCGVNLLKIQNNAFLNEEKELTKQEYQKLLQAAEAEKKERLYHLILTICSTGIRVSELRFVTVEALVHGRAEVSMKGKNRMIILPRKLIQKLKNYVEKQKITSGPIFCTRSGRPMDRSNICHEMKKLGERIGVNREKVHPHSLRHLFARQFYSVHKNLAHLADVLGHSSIETTRIYVAVSAREHEQTMESMDLVL
ncbi:MAG: tyrosine-type recombinase/integrase [Brotaphodocola sp.]